MRGEVGVGLGGRVAEAPGSLAGAQEPLRAGDVAEPAPAEAEQVPGGESAPAGVVGRIAGSSLSIDWVIAYTTGMPRPSPMLGRGSIRRPATISPST